MKRFPVGLIVYIQSPYTVLKQGVIVKETLHEGGSRIDTQWSAYVYTIEVVSGEQTLTFEFSQDTLAQWNRRLQCTKRWFHRHTVSCFQVCLPPQDVAERYIVDADR